VIEDSTCSTNENIYSLPELISLIINRDTSIDCENIVFIFVMFLGVKFLCDLKGKLSGRSKNHSLDFTVSQSLVLSQEFHERKRETKSLSRAGQVSNDQVLAFPDVIKGLILDREQLGNASDNEDFS